MWMESLEGKGEEMEYMFIHNRRLVKILLTHAESADSTRAMNIVKHYLQDL